MNLILSNGRPVRNDLVLWGLTYGIGGLGQKSSVTDDCLTHSIVGSKLEQSRGRNASNL